MKIPTRLLFWFEMPLDISDRTVSEDDALQFLKKDIYLLARPYSKLQKIMLKYQEDLAPIVFLFNLDNILVMARASNERARYSFCTDFAEQLTKLGVERCIIHSKLMDNEIKEIFSSRQIRYITMNTLDHQVTIDRIMKEIEPVFKLSPDKREVSLVIDYYPEKKFKANIISLNDPTKRNVSATVKKLWLNGITLQLDEPDNMQLYDIKNILKIQIDFLRQKVLIAKSIIATMEDATITVVYDISNAGMISDDDSEFLLKELYREIEFDSVD